MIGKSLAHYEITEKIGEGGMGQVFRARDGKLGRDVALKVLPKEMSGDVERAMRFEREARTLASLQHPNVASVYGFEEVDGIRFLVMELVEGEDLSERLKRGAISLEDSIEIAVQVAAGLEAAHDQGIVHRDLKPANIKLSPTGEVKVLDFGLARAYLGDARDASDINNSPTITAALTGTGTILGTAAYMSPEQARGKALDTRTDLWAFGVILFEMLTGQRLFAGETVSDTLAAVLRAEPDMDALPADTPPGVRRLLRRCLERDPKLRLRSAGDASLDLLEKRERRREASLESRPPRLLYGLIGILALALAFSFFTRPEKTTTVARALHLDITPAPSLTIVRKPPALSPDGQWLAYIAEDSLGTMLLQLRSLTNLATETLYDPNVVGLAAPEHLFWSPDSRYLGIQEGGSISALDISTRSVQAIYENRGSSRGASWNVHGDIIFSPDANTEIQLISSRGGRVRSVTTIDTTLADASHRWPTFLPDGRRFLFTAWSNATREKEAIGGIYLGSLDGTAPVALLDDPSMAILDPSGGILFHRDGKLMRVELDLEAGEVRGSPVLIADEVTWDTNNALVMATVSSVGDLLYLSGELNGSHTLGWASLDGGFSKLMDIPGSLFSVDLSSDGRLAAVQRVTLDSSLEVWIADLERLTLSRLSRFDSDCTVGSFSPDGLRVSYTTQTPGSDIIYLTGVDGATAPEAVVENSTLFTEVTDWSADGKLLFFMHVRHRSDTSRISVFDIDSGEIRTILNDDYWQGAAVLSPDARWLAYASEESGRREVFVRPFPGLDRKWQISVDGGDNPAWNTDGSALVFDGERGSTYSVQIRFDGNELRAATPKFLRTFRSDIVAKDIDATHSRYLVARRQHAGSKLSFRYVSNWGAALSSQTR